MSNTASNEPTVTISVIDIISIPNSSMFLSGAFAVCTGHDEDDPDHDDQDHIIITMTQTGITAGVIGRTEHEMVARLEASGMDEQEIAEELRHSEHKARKFSLTWAQIADLAERELMDGAVSGLVSQGVFDNVTDISDLGL
jgi:hypothetical protein